MKYNVFVFKADQNEELCMDYCRQHSAVLSEYGCAGIGVSRESWMDNPNAYVVVVYDAAGKMVSGVRLQLGNTAHPLQIASDIFGVDKIVRELNGEGDNITAELCSLWTARDIRHSGMAAIVSRTATAFARQLGARSLFVLASCYTHRLYQELGYIAADLAGRYGAEQRPASDYASTVMLVPDLKTLAHATPEQQKIMFSLRENPAQMMLDGDNHDLLIQYELGRLFHCTPVAVQQLPVAA